MEKDFSIKGREEYLSLICHDTHFKYEKRDALFARQTLLQRVIWKFKPNDSYCHLDSFGADLIHNYDYGFMLMGRVWLLNPNAFGSDVYTAMAVEFDPESETIKRARFWVSYMPVIKGLSPPDIEILPLRHLFSNAGNLGRDWHTAFTRNSTGWTMNPSFDLSVFLGSDFH